jgi:hypothetical protein
MLALAVGAPPEILRGAQRAGLDEIRHAEGCFALARRYDGRATGPGTLALEGALTGASLAELAALTVHEGCVGETLGVFLATAQRDAARDIATRGFLERLVSDEQRHAELAWSFVRWALSVGGAEVHAAVQRAFDEAIAASLALQGGKDPDVDEDAWRKHGRLVARETRALVRRGIGEIVGPCRRALAQLATAA